ncbi:zinc transporter ZIP3-like [Culicoides brevitarsis]|uniref:zinc transporter ZIP3-like n=1 Tax=Culicoides brevitarsis TaxID=469753 RepID=UPI00307C6C42
MNSEDENKEIIIAKVTAMVVLFSASTICGLAPFKLSKWFNWGDNNTNTGASKVVALLLSFGGGVLLSTTFCHLLPDVQENIRKLQEKEMFPILRFDAAPLLLCAGFFMVYFIEEAVHWYMHKREHDMALKAEKAENAFQRGRSSRNSMMSHNKKKLSDAENPENGNGVKTELEQPEVENENFKKYEDLQEHHDKYHHNPNMPHSHIPHEEDSFSSNMRGLLIVLALSIHELFEGLAVGLESSSSTVWYMFGAVSAHKYVIAFCIGVELVVNKTKTWLGITYILIYSFVSALGIGIGIILVNGTNADDMEVPSAILQGLAAGTLLFVVFFEILCKDKSGLPQFLAVLVGFVAIFGIQILTEPANKTVT